MGLWVQSTWFGKVTITGVNAEGNTPTEHWHLQMRQEEEPNLHKNKIFIILCNYSFFANQALSFGPCLAHASPTRSILGR